MIAVVGQCVLDRVTAPGHGTEERLGGSPLFASEALLLAGATFRVAARGGDEALRAPLLALGVPVVVGPAALTFTSVLDLHPGGTRDHRLASLGDPFTPADVAGWMAPALDGARAVACGAQWRGDFPPETLAALAADGRLVCLDAQGPCRPERTGPVAPEGPLDPAWLTGVHVLKASEEEAAALLGGESAEDARRAGVPVVLVTRGEGPVTVHERGRSTEVHVEPVRGLAETIGAGDAFLALVAAALADGLDAPDAARRACDGVAALLAARRDAGAS